MGEPRPPQHDYGGAFRARARVRAGGLGLGAAILLAVGVFGVAGLRMEGDRSPLAWITVALLLASGLFLLYGFWRARTMKPREIVLKRRALVMPARLPIWSAPDVELHLASIERITPRMDRGYRRLELTVDGASYAIHGGWFAPGALEVLERLLAIRVDASVRRDDRVDELAREAFSMEAPGALGLMIDTSGARPRVTHVFEDLDGYEALLGASGFEARSRVIALAPGTPDRLRAAVDERFEAALEVGGFRDGAPALQRRGSR